MVILILVFRVTLFLSWSPFKLEGNLTGFAGLKNPENRSRIRFEASTELRRTLYTVGPVVRHLMGLTTTITSKLT